MRVGEERIAKRLHRFLVGEDVVTSIFQIRKWVESCGESDHNHIMLDIKGDIRQPPIPFKFNARWLKDPNFITLVNSNLILLDLVVGNRVAS